jgi:hypothetical protein
MLVLVLIFDEAHLYRSKKSWVLFVDALKYTWLNVLIKSMTYLYLPHFEVQIILTSLELQFLVVTGWVHF